MKNNNSFYRIIAATFLAAILFATSIPRFIAIAETRNVSLPEQYYENCPEQGDVQESEFDTGAKIVIWTPYGYNKGTKYNLVLLLHGANGCPQDWISQVQSYAGREYKAQTLYDWITYDGLCEPFIVASIPVQANRGSSNMLDDIILAIKYMTKNFSTWANDDSDEALIEARDHIILGGLSRGAIFTMQFAAKHLELVGNYIVLSGVGSPETVVNVMKETQVQPRGFFFGAGRRESDYNDWAESASSMLEKYIENVDYESYDSGHDWGTWITGIYDGLRFEIGTDTVYQLVKQSVNKMKEILVKQQMEEYYE